MIDRIHYVLPFAPFSEIAHSLLVTPRLKAIFDYRIAAVEKIFGP
jgi:ligand-binding SRPBCC domain-containing protein